MKQLTVRPLHALITTALLSGCSNLPIDFNSDAGITKASGGAFATGGTNAGGGSTSPGGANASGGSTSPGGAITTGGTLATGSTTGAGCTASFEALQIVSGLSLCVANTVTITGPSASSNYQIDATEVTNGQYDAWLATNPSLPASTDTSCGWKSSGSYAEMGSDYTGTDADHHPVVEVDWCDAYYYCAAVGKRLCGAIGGGPNTYVSIDASTGQWYRACSSGGADTYPYGNTYQATYCNGYDYGAGTTTTVGSLSNCVTSTAGYAGAYDLAGNVWEWEDSCNGSTGESDLCPPRGGSFDQSGSPVCNQVYGGHARRGGVSGNFGFRCCSA